MAYKSVVKTYESEVTEKKSRFIGRIYPVNSEEEVKRIIGEVRKEHHQASHHCTAFRLHTSPIVERYSDDGEPGGTAGMPMLEVLRGRCLENVLLVSIRYFGGTKLGTGGLVRAYTRSAQDVLDQAMTVEVGTFNKLAVQVAYTLSGKISYHIEQHHYVVDDVSYGEQVVYKLYIAHDHLSRVQEEVMELTNGHCQMTLHDPIDGYICDGRMMTGEIEDE